MQLPDYKMKLVSVDMAYVDESAKDDDGVKFLIVCQDLFDGTIDAKGLKQKIPEKRFAYF